MANGFPTTARTASALSPGRRDGDRRKVLLLGLVLVAVTVVAFLPCLFNGFVIDDGLLVVDNPAIRDLSWAGVKRLWTSPLCGNYVPLTLTSFAADFRVWGLDPMGYHVTNLLLHLVNGLLVWLFAYVVTRNIAAGFVAALLWSVHPLRVESVAWVSERKDVVYAAFFLAGLVAYDRWSESRRSAWYHAALCCSVLSLFAKPAAVSFPLALLCLEYVRRGRPDRRIFVGTVPFFAVAGIGTLVTIVSQSGVLWTGARSWFSLLLPVEGLVLYLEKTIAPVGLSCLYPVPSPGALLDSLPRSLLVLACCAVLLMFSRGRTRIGVFGALFFLATILPSLKIVGFAVGMAADRYTYLPSVGLACIAAEAFMVFIRGPGTRSRLLRAAAGAGMSLAAVALASLTWQRCGVWKNETTVWSDAVANHPDTISYTYLGIARGLEKDYGRAIRYLSIAVHLDPYFAKAYANRAVAYGELGDHERSLRDYQRAIEVASLRPAGASELLGIHAKRALLYEAMGEYDPAIADYTAAIAMDPGDARLRCCRGAVYARKGDAVSAVADYDEAIRMDPAYALAYYGRALVAAERGDHGRAIADLSTAIALSPDFAPAYHRRAVSRLAAGDPRGARDDVREAEERGFIVPHEFIETLRKALPGPG